MTPSQEVKAPRAPRGKRGNKQVRRHAGTLVGKLRNCPQPAPALEIPVSEAGERRRRVRMKCGKGEPARYLIGRHRHTRAIEVHGMDCKQRTCRRCAPKRKHRIRSTLELMLKKHQGRALFITLTVPQPCADQALPAWKGFSKMFRLFWKRLKRALPGALKGVEFAWVLEPHKSGWPHLHMLLFGVNFLHWTKLLACWRAVGGGKVDVQRVRGNATAYLTTYVSKQHFADDDLADWLTDNRVRWYNASHKVSKDKPAPQCSLIEWTMVKAENIIEHLNGYRIETAFDVRSIWLLDLERWDQI